MKTVFYAPMKSLADEKPSGDRTMASLLVNAMGRRSTNVFILDGLTSYTPEPSGYPAEKKRLQELWAKIADDTIGAMEPDLWVTYHSYYKSPDLIGPMAAAQFNLPYAIFEPSYAPNRLDTDWAEALADAKRSFDSADLLFVMKQKDWDPLKQMLGSDEKLVRFPPFIDAAPFAGASGNNVRTETGISADTPIILCTAMMRAGAKQESYSFLAQALSHISDLKWHLLIAGSGPARTEVKRAFGGNESRVSFLGQADQADLPTLYAAADLFAWPGIREAYGMVYLEAAAAGVPSIAMDGPGVREVIENGKTGVLTAPKSAEAYGDALRRLLTSPDERRQMGFAAQSWAATERSVTASLPRLDPLFDLVERR